MNEKNFKIIKGLKSNSNFQSSKNKQKIQKFSKSFKITENRDAILKAADIDDKKYHIRENDENRKLTKIEIYIIRKQKGLEFLLKNQGFFLTHSFKDIPDHLISRIEDLSECSLVQERIPSSARQKEVVDKASEFLKCVFTNPPFLLAKSISSKINSGVKFQILFGNIQDVDIHNDLVVKLDLDKRKTDSSFGKRLNERTNTNLIISDYGACLMLPDRSGLADVNNVIVGYDQKFIQWCNDFFEFNWKQGQPFARLRAPIDPNNFREPN